MIDSLSSLLKADGSLSSEKCVTFRQGAIADPLKTHSFETGEFTVGGSSSIKLRS